MIKRVWLGALGGAVFVASVGAAYAEPGDYGPLRTYHNLVKPQKADDPVSYQERLGPYALNAPTTGFEDGFVPDNYDQWQQVDVPAETGAACGNGTPYKFFVRRVADNNNMLIYFEGGGACWDYPSCSGAAGIRGARNPDGIPDGYVQNVDLRNLESFDGLDTAAVSPLIFPEHPYNQFKTANWNMVYVPYCTGDIYVGDKVQVYEDPEGVEPDLVWNHNGLRNVQSVVSWVKNNLKSPTQLAVAGCSAGSIGALLNYSKLRGHFESPYGYLLDDSGPLFNAPLASEDTDAYPSIPLHREVISQWTTYGEPGDNPISAMAAITPGFDPQRLATVYGALSSKFHDDRLGMTFFLADGNFSSYSYERFYPEIENNPDDEAKLEQLRALWQHDTQQNLLPLLDATHNWSYHLPMFRDFNESHCTTVLDLRYSEIEELGTDLPGYLESLIDYRGGPPMRGFETDNVSDFINNHDPFYDLIDRLL
ncbi:hypothetical protein E4634_17815 [Mangrovimicrobium sediminis]|uniref:Pectinacetylesterase n=1 Tax=Mangrovimicrobium sediminis TaxID=2562682 RepID=A0A4Z0LW50_9GAMM|nr:pectin acetylesterase-family hydrolase [Haliea sp. SAOS-164]TGD71511.1 hypothetical protein E4634_17815 [Haliea sp. SAOS-164]